MKLQYNEKIRKHYGLAYVIEYWKKLNGGWKGEGGTCPFFRFLVLQ